MVERIGEMRKGRRGRIEKGNRERREKRERDKRELRRQFKEEEGLIEKRNNFTWTSNTRKSQVHEVIHIIFTSHKYNFVINNSLYQLPLLGFCK